ncbi:MAG: ComF family protein [Mangrovibacterium sp.]
MNYLREGFKQFGELLFPRYCVVCRDKLIQTEQYICLKCLLHLPRTNHIGEKNNPMEQLFYGRVPIERACAFMEFKKGSDYQHLLHELKYRRQKELGEVLGLKFGAALKSDGQICSADFICPVPLHPKKERQRGYNQSFYLAKGLSQALGIPVNSGNIYRDIHTSTQTRKSRWERWQNVEGIFAVRQPELFAGKHLILVDDVITTGATMEACVTAVLEQCEAKISVLTLAIA